MFTCMLRAVYAILRSIQMFGASLCCKYNMTSQTFGKDKLGCLGFLSSPTGRMRIESEGEVCDWPGGQIAVDHSLALGDPRMPT